MADEEEVIVEEESKDIDIEVEDDTPEADKGRDRRADDAEADIPDDEEVKDYSKRAQKRIKHVTWEFNEERRGKEEAQRIRDNAVEFARGQHNELVRLRQTLAKGEVELVNSNKMGSEARLESSRSSLRSANESGDSDAIAKAQEELSRAVTEADRWRGYRPQYQVDQNDPRNRSVPAPQPQQQPRVPTPTPEASDWGKRNSWFNKDEFMTAHAYGYHREMVKDGVELDSDDYYKKLDKEMVRVFPSAFSSEDGGQSRQKDTPSHRATVVASSSRTEGRPRKVKLTTSQVSLARRLGITAEDYAREVLKQETGT